VPPTPTLTRPRSPVPQPIPVSSRCYYTLFAQVSNVSMGTQHTLGLRSVRSTWCPSASPTVFTWLERAPPPGTVLMQSGPVGTAFSSFADFSFGGWQLAPTPHVLHRPTACWCGKCLRCLRGPLCSPFAFLCVCMVGLACRVQPVSTALPDTCRLQFTLDNSSWSFCQESFRLGPLAPGLHSVSLRCTNGSATSPVVTREWTVLSKSSYQLQV
jgi:hypothetical protein